MNGYNFRYGMYIDGSVFLLRLVYEWVLSGDSRRKSVPKTMASYTPVVVHLYISYSANT